MPPTPRVEQLLEKLGFTGNPFTTREADRQIPEETTSYFFEHYRFPEILGTGDHPESVIVLAERGAGKTTFRQEIENRCRRQSKPVAGVLAVSYTEFARPLAQARQQQTAVDISLHVDEILRCAVGRLLAEMDEVRARTLLELQTRERGSFATLSAFIRYYTPLFDADDYGAEVTHLVQNFARREQLDLRLPFDMLELLAADGAARIADLPPLLQALGRGLVALYNQAPRRLADTTYLGRLRAFLDLLNALGYQAMYVLIDRLDETSLLAPGELIPFIAPLVTDLQLLDEDRLAFKIFLPSHLRDDLQAAGLRSKRLRPIELAWSDDDLLLLLGQRLRSFTRTGVSSLQPFCVPALGQRTVVNFSRRHPNPRYVDVALVQAARGIPRDLILRCRKLFEFYELRDSQDAITDSDLQQAATVVLGSDAPPEPATASRAGALIPLPDSPRAAPQMLGLDVDAAGRIWRDGVRLHQRISPQSLQVLRYLCARRGQVCDRRDMLRALWGERYEDLRLVDMALSRLRKIVEYDPANPQFIITQPGIGVVLEPGEFRPGRVLPEIAVLP